MNAAPPPPPLRSWADHTHGWRAVGAGVEATDDGGHHWRVVFRTPRVQWLTRTSVRAGLVRSDAGVFVTEDAGRHWSSVSGFAGTQAFGRDGALYVADGPRLRRADEWPPARVRSGMTIPTTVVYTLSDPTESLRLRAMWLATGIEADVIQGSTVVARLTHADWITNVDPVTPPVQPIQSWADRDHGWRGTAKGVEATSDGVHWRVVFSLGVASGASVDVLHRTSASAGMADIAGRLWVTIDAGRHWYQATGGPTEPSFGRGSVLFGTGGSGIEQAVQWPPRHVRCAGRWVHSAAWFSALTPGPKPRRICQQDSGLDVAMRRVWTEPTPPEGASWEVFGRSLVNGVLTADVVDDTSEQWQLVGTVVYRNGRATFTPVTTPR